MGHDLDAQIAEWASFVSSHRPIDGGDVDELEAHLRDQIGELVDAGLTPDEAFLVAVKRMGSINDLSREFAREHSDRLWRQLVLGGGGSETEAATAGFWVMAAFAVVAAVVVRLPEAFGLDMVADGESFYARNLSLLVFPVLAGYLAWVRPLGRFGLGVLAAWFALGAVVVNLYPFEPGGSTEILAAIHLPVALWGAVGFAYVGGEWRSHTRRMDFVRFTGEWFIYYVLIALGGGVLVGLTIGVFGSVGVDVSEFVGGWVVPWGAAGALIVAAWLVEAKQGVIESMAPVLTSVFTPLFALMLVVSVVVAAFSGSGVDADREVLIIFDVLLVVVTGLLLYAISARDRDARRGPLDVIRLVLVAAAIALDLIGLGAMIVRISEFGFSPNKTAALGLNLILLVTLTWSGLRLLGFVRGRESLGPLERWQTVSLPVYAAWAAAVVVGFPLVFSFT